MIIENERSSEIPSLVRHSLDLIKEPNPTERARFFQSFSHKTGDQLERLVNVARTIGEGKRKLVFSVDLCELFDLSKPALSYNTNQNEAGIRRQLIHSDILFSRKSMQYLLDTKHLFTILPGTAVEIIQHLKKIYADAALWQEINGWNKQGRSDVFNWIKQGNSTKFLKEKTRLLCTKLVRHNEFLIFLTQLLNNKNFVQFELQPQQMGFNKELFDARFKDYRSALDGLRKDSANNIADAVNLALATEITANTNNEYAVTHMTRTAVLHKLNNGAYEMDVRSTYTSDDGLSFPILCHPHMLCVLSMLDPSGEMEPGRLEDTVCEFHEFFIGFNNRFRRLFNEIRKGHGWKGIMERWNQLNTWVGDQKHYNSSFFRDYTKMYIENAIHSEQMLYFNTDFSEETKSEIDHSLGEAQTVNLLDNVCQLIESVASVTIKDNPHGRSIFPHSTGLTKCEKSGLSIDKVDISDHSLSYEVKTHVDNRILFGLQLNQQYTNLYWITTQTITAFMTAMRTMTADPNQEFTVTGITVSGLPLIFHSSANQLIDNFKKLGCEVEVLQIEVADVIYTIELAANNRNPFTSIRFKGPYTDSTHNFYSALGGVLPKDYVFELTETLPRGIR